MPLQLFNDSRDKSHDEVNTPRAGRIQVLTRVFRGSRNCLGKDLGAFWFARGAECDYSKAMSEPVVFQKFPIVQPMEPGVYYWCSCGVSKKQPFCDGSHKGTEFSPLKTEIKGKKTVAWCACKRTRTKPFCDGSHKSL
jgi:CDGSH-type Zn-finger protein